MPYLSLLLAMMLAGSVVPAGKAVADLPPFVAAFARYLLASAILVPMAWRDWERLPRLPGRDVLLLLAQGAAGSLGFSVCMLMSVRYTGAAEASIVTGTLPAAVTVLSLLAGERIGVRDGAMVVLATVGVILLDRGSIWAGMPGLALAVLAVFAEAAFVTLNRRLSTPVPPSVIAAAMTVLGAAFTLPAALWDLGALPRAAPVAWLALSYHAVVPTVGGFLLWYWGAARVAGVAAAPFTAAMPATGVVLAWSVWGEPVTGGQLGGLALVFAAVAAPFLAGRKEV